MYIRCWGSRGSLPVSGKQFMRYGGDTTCIEVRSKKGDIVVIDAGTGILGLGIKLSKLKEKKINMLFTHAHLDHIMGFPFFYPIYNKNTEILIYGCPFQFPSYREILKGIMSSPYFPVDLEAIPCILRFNQIGSQPFNIGSLIINPIYLSHPNGGLGYKITEGKSTFVFLTDNELEYIHPGGLTLDEYAEFSKGADLLIHDAEFSPSDYNNNRTFGHSKYTEVIKLGIKAQVKALGLFHLNRERTDKEVDSIVEKSKKIIKKNNCRIKCFCVGNRFEINL